MKFAALAGLARSLLMYYAIPGRARAWRIFYGQFISPGDLCFDIGAHVGNRTAAMLALGARVVSVEPQPIYASVLEYFYTNRLNFTLVEKAIGSESGRMEMLISSRTPTVSTLSKDWVIQVAGSSGFSGVDWDEQIRVEVITLDNLITDYGMPVFCKLDIEGSEPDALRGLSHPIPAVSFEYVPASLKRALECVDMLDALKAYRFNYINSERPRFSRDGWVGSSELKSVLKAISPSSRAGEIYARSSP